VLVLLAALWRRGRGREAAALAGAAAVVAAPYVLATRLSTGGYTYAGGYWRLTSAAALLSNAYFYLKGLALLTCVYFPAFWPNAAWLKAAAIAAVAGLAAWGAWRQARRGEGWALPAYAALYGAACLAWPFQAPRFMEPLAPFFAFWLAAGVEAAAPRRALAPALAALALAGGLSNAGQLAGLARASWPQPVESAHQAESWLGEHARPSDLVVSMDVARLRYFAGLRGVHFIPAGSAEEFAAKARALGARWFFVRGGGYVGFAGGRPSVVARQQDRLASYLERRDLFTLVHEDAAEGARVYALAAPAISR
jgi:hypothetical protein